MTSVSVVIPCYNYGHFLEEAVGSVLDDQQGVDVQVLIIDDASPDNSGEVAAKIAAREPRVEAILHATNVGNIATFNEGVLEWAAGDYCVLMSADDRLTPGALRRATDLMNSHTNVGFVYGHPLWFTDGAPLPAARSTVRGWSVWPGQWWLERRFRDAENPITSPEVVVRTSVRKRVGRYDTRVPHGADMEMWLRLAASADVGFLRGVDQAYYRLHDQNMRKAFSAVMDLQERKLVFDLVLERYGERLSDVTRLSTMVRSALGREALWAAGLLYDPRSPELSSVDELLAFAFDCCPAVNKLPLYRALQLRTCLSPRAMRGLQPLVESAVFSGKVHRWLRRRSWEYRGV